MRYLLIMFLSVVSVGCFPASSAGSHKCDDICEVTVDLLKKGVGKFRIPIQYYYMPAEGVILQRCGYGLSDAADLIKNDCATVCDAILDLMEVDRFGKKGSFYIDYFLKGCTKRLASQAIERLFTMNLDDDVFWESLECFVSRYGVEVLSEHQRQAILTLLVAGQNGTWAMGDKECVAVKTLSRLLKIPERRKKFDRISAFSPV